MAVRVLKAKLLYNALQRLTPVMRFATYSPVNPTTTSGETPC